MNSVDRTLLALIRLSLNDKREQSFSVADWGKIYKLSCQQGVNALAVDGLQQLMKQCPDAIAASETPHDKVHCLQWIGQVMAYERMYAKYETAMFDLARLYATKGIRLLVLKGYGLSLDWPVPNHRPMGDLDIYHFGRWREADLLVEEVGVKVDDGHEQHTVFMYKGIPVENHYDFINTKAHRDAPKIEARLKALAEKGCKEIEVQGAKIYIPSADFNAIFLMRHMGQHFAGEHLNLRQVLDWGFFVRAHHEEVNWSETIDFLKEIGLYTFFNQINAICVDYLGFDETVFPSVERKEELENRILADILYPGFAEEKPLSGLLPVLTFKFRRWWHNRWKHPLVYKEWLLPRFLTLLWSLLRRYKTIKD